ncbi:MAG: tetratricopeptide repeat protein [Verrucomicrobiota bacterium]|nr:tetratricopeptide repeat protein [Verrucomicrobiota bacterium]
MKGSSSAVWGFVALLAGCVSPAGRPHSVNLDLTEDGERFRDALAHYGQAYLYEKELSWFSNLALDHYRTAAELDPSVHALQSKVALNYLHRNQLDKAVEVLETSCRVSRGLLQPWVDLATVCQISGRLDRAIAAYRRALAIAPEHTVIYCELAKLLLFKDRDAEAVSAVEEGIRNADNRDALVVSAHNQARAFLGGGKPARALPFFRLVADNVVPEKLPASFFLCHGVAHERCGNAKAAEEIFEKCLRLYPGTHEALNYLAYMWAERGINLDRANDYVLRALAKEPDNGAYLDTLGWIYYKQKRYADSLDSIAKANRLIRDDPVVMDHLGDAFFALGDRTKAVWFWKKSFLTDPTNSAVALKLKAEGVNVETLRTEAERLKKEKETLERAPVPAAPPDEAAIEIRVP